MDLCSLSRQGAGATQAAAALPQFLARASPYQRAAAADAVVKY
jgi:hypothetical protein